MIEVNEIVDTRTDLHRIDVIENLFQLQDLEPSFLWSDTHVTPTVFAE